MESLLLEEQLLEEQVRIQVLFSGNQFCILEAVGSGIADGAKFVGENVAHGAGVVAGGAGELEIDIGFANEMVIYSCCWRSCGRWS